MRRSIFSVIVMATISIFVIGCGASETGSDAQTHDEVVKEEEQVDSEALAKTAYELLNTSSDTADKIMSSVLEAWYFSVDKGNDYVLKDYYSGVYDFSKDLGLDSGAVNDAFKEVIKGTTYETMFTSQAFKEPVICVKMALKCYEDAGIIDSVNELLSDAKQDIKDVESAEPNASYLEDLKKYHSEIQSYFDFAQNPTGSYKECSAEAENYRTNLKTFKNNLAFDLE